MSDKLKIKLSIANRVYPLTIEPSQEEGLRKAALKIDAMINNLSKAILLEINKMYWPCVLYNLHLKTNRRQ